MLFSQSFCSYFIWISIKLVEFGIIPYKTVGHILKMRVQKLLEQAEPKLAEVWRNFIFSKFWFVFYLDKY